MVDRIKKVMEYYEFTPSDFADALGVSRSNLTHVFSGRNQPSLDFARRVLMAFPEISSEWLIMGVGEMIKPAGSEPEPPKKYIQTDLFATAEDELGWGESNENNEELEMGNEESDDRSQMSEGESVRGNGSSEELGVRNEEKGENENENENEKEIPLLSRRGAEGGVVDNPTVEKSDVRGQMSVGESEEGNRNSEVLGVRSEKSDVRSQMSEVESEKSNETENRNVNSAQPDVPIVTNITNEPIQPQQQKIMPNEKMPKMETKQTDTKIVRQRRPLPSSSLESKIQHQPTPGLRISDSREPVSVSEKKVVKIIFFYDDDSFKIYHP